MSEWKTYRLGDICQVLNGRAYKQEELLNQGPYPVLRVGNIFQGNNWYYSDLELPDDKYCYNGDLLYAWSCGFAPYIWKGKKSIYHYHIWKLKENPQIIDKLFFYYYLIIHTKYNLGGTHGSVMLHLTKKDFENQTLHLPPLDEQRRIAGILGSLDDKIELNRRINANLEAQAQALFQSWFVDFEPFRDGPFVDSQLGKIPQGWKVGTINEIIQILSGYAFKSDTFTEAGPYRLITIKNVQDGSLNIDGAAYLSEIPDKMPQHCNLAIGDILLSLTGNVGRVCIVDRDGLLLNQRVAKLQPKDKRNTFFTYALFRQDSFKQYLIQIAKGTAQLNLSPVETSDTKIVLPNQDILLQFGEIGQPLFDNIVSNCKEIITLSALRDTLLPKLIAGEI